VKNFWTKPRSVPIVVAHRGASLAAPENTLNAFRRAVADGAGALEFDVRLTRDGEVVVFHDQRLGRTAEGKGNIADVTLCELRRLSAGRWFHEQFASEKIPTLSEVLEEFGKTTGLNIELKGGRFSRSLSLPDRVLSIVRNARVSDSILFSSFIHPFIKHIKRHTPELPAGLLLLPHTALTLRPAMMKRKYGADYIIVGGGALRKSMVDGSHREELKVAEYTVNTGRRYARALRYGVDAVITDDPKQVLSFQKK
jgi:glycerophosphoryl diester phosphodiesterase